MGDILHSVEFNEAFEKIWIIGNGKRVGDKESFTSLEIIKGTGRKNLNKYRRFVRLSIVPVRFRAYRIQSLI